MNPRNRLFASLASLFLFLTLSQAACALPSLDPQRLDGRLLVIATGGTIASVKTPDGLAPSIPVEQLLHYVPELKKLKRVKGLQLFQLDSSNMHPKNWQTLARTIYKKQNDFDGIVVLHGTDTMAFTASALEVMLDPHKPVVLTGAMEPVGTSGGDAEENLIDAIRVALSGQPGVSIVMNRHVYPAKQVFKKDSKDRDAFGLVSGTPATVDAFLKHPLRRKGKVPLHDGLVDEVACIRLQPGLRPTTLTRMAGSLRGIVIQAYGMGGIPFQGADLLPAIRQLLERKIPVLVASQCPFGGADMRVYEVGVKALKLGVIPVEACSIEYATVKLMSSLYYGKNFGQVNQLLRGL